MGVVAALAAGEPVILLTLTEPTLARSFGDSSKALTAFMKRLQHRYGGGLRWFAVAEWQRRGAVHWHCLMIGLAYCRPARNGEGRRYLGHPHGAHTWEVRKWADLRPLAVHYGFGRVLDVHAVGVGADAHTAAEDVGRYLSKYLTKIADAHRLPKGARLVRTSRGRNQWVPGLTLTSLSEAAREHARSRGTTPAPAADAASPPVFQELSPTPVDVARLRIWQSNRVRLRRLRAAQERLR